jgi:surface-anchored protein
LFFNKYAIKGLLYIIIFLSNQTTLEYFIMKRYLSFLTLSFIIVSILSLPLSAASYYSKGHADLGLGDGEELELHLHCHKGAIVDGVALTADEEFAPNEVIILVPESTKNYVHGSGGAAPQTFAGMLGLNMGDDYWFLPQDADGEGGAVALNAPDFGIGAEDIAPGVFDGGLEPNTGRFSLKLLSMAFPAGGQFGLQDYDSGWFMSTANGISGDDRIDDIPVGAHAHLNWYFTKPGVYELTFAVSAMRDGVPESDINTFTFQVVPEPGSLTLLLSAISAALLAFVSRRTK